MRHFKYLNYFRGWGNSMSLEAEVLENSMNTLNLTPLNRVEEEEVEEQQSLSATDTSLNLTPLQKVDEPEENKISKLEYISNPEIMDKIRRFDKSKYGEEGGQQEGETNEEYFERFLTFKRAIEQNTIDQSGMIDWIRTASPEERDEFLDVYKTEWWFWNTYNRVAGNVLNVIPKKYINLLKMNNNLEGYVVPYPHQDAPCFFRTPSFCRK